MKRAWMISVCLALSGSVAADIFRWTDPATGKLMVSDQPPPGSYRNLVRLSGGEAADTPLPYATRVAAEKYPVTLFTTANCVAECKVGRELLNARGVPFSENMMQKPEQFESLKALSGNTMVPTLKVGTQVFQGFQAEAWNNLLDLAGYPAAAPVGSRPVSGLPAAPQ